MVLLVCCLLSGRSANFLSEPESFVRYTNYVAGVVLIILGILIFTDNVVVLVGRLFSFSPLKL